MTLKYVNITAPAGGSFVSSHDIAFKRLLLVSLEGTSYDIITGSSPVAGERKVQFLRASGGLQFAPDINFAAFASVYALIRQS